MTPTGSRRIQDVWPAMYSAAALPPRLRAAPAKDRILSTIGGDSSPRVRRGGVGAVDVLGRRHGSRGEDLAGGRVHQVGPAAVGGVDVLAADEVAQLELVAHGRSLSFDCAAPVVIVPCRCQEVQPPRRIAADSANQ